MAVKNSRTQHIETQQVVGKKKTNKNGKVDRRPGGKTGR